MSATGPALLLDHERPSVYCLLEVSEAADLEGPARN